MRLFALKKYYFEKQVSNIEVLALGTSHVL
jgi:hypothetical protein